jgi:hypothetical protein
MAAPTTTFESACSRIARGARSSSDFHYVCAKAPSPNNATSATLRSSKVSRANHHTSLTRIPPLSFRRSNTRRSALRVSDPHPPSLALCSPQTGGYHWNQLGPLDVPPFTTLPYADLAAAAKSSRACCIADTAAEMASTPFLVFSNCCRETRPARRAFRRYLSKS